MMCPSARVARAFAPVDAHSSVRDAPAAVSIFEPIEIAAADSRRAVGFGRQGEVVACHCRGLAAYIDDDVGDVVLTYTRRAPRCL
jgi:hypothetical protein